MSAAIRPTTSIVRKGRKGASGPIAEARPHPATMISFTYDRDEHDYLVAVQQFKARTGRKFPTVSDMLLIAKSIGFTRTATTNSEGR
jgi:hypothetical protein